MKKTQKAAGPAATSKRTLSTGSDTKAARTKAPALTDGWQRIFDRLTPEQQRRVRTEAKSARKPLKEYLFDTVVRGMVEGPEAQREWLKINSTIGQALGRSIRERIDRAASKGLGLDMLDMVRIGVGRVLDEYESSGSVKAGAKFVAAPQRPKARRAPDALRTHGMELDLSSLTDDEWNAFRDKAAAAGRTPDDQLRALVLGEIEGHAAPVTVSDEHQQRLRFIGDMLEVQPGTFLEWILDDLFRDMLNASTGQLHDWTCGGMVKYSAAAAKRVRARYRAWEKKELGHNRKWKGVDEA